MTGSFTILCAIAATLDEVKEAPESALWLLFMSDLSLNEFQKIIEVLISMGICRVSGHLVIFTEPATESASGLFLTEVRRHVTARHAASSELN